MLQNVISAAYTRICKRKEATDPLVLTCRAIGIRLMVGPFIRVTLETAANIRPLLMAQNPISYEQL